MRKTGALLTADGDVNWVSSYGKKMEMSQDLKADFFGDQDVACDQEVVQR